MRPPIFVTGCPRSGTTMLAKILAHKPYSEFVSSILVSPHVVHRIALGMPQEEYAFHCFSARTQIPLLLSQKRQRRLLLLADFLKGRLSWQDFFVSFIKVRSLPKKQREDFYNNCTLIYHEPFFTVTPAFMLDIFADAKVFHIIRDPRACVSSFIHNFDAFSDSLIAMMQENKAVYWQQPEIAIAEERNGKRLPYWVKKDDEDLFLKGSRFVRAYLLWEYLEAGSCRKIAADPRFTEDNYFKVKYEDLVSSPKAFCQKISDFIKCRIFAHAVRGIHIKSLSKYKSHIDRESLRIIDARYDAVKPFLFQKCR